MFGSPVWIRFELLRPARRRQSGHSSNRFKRLRLSEAFGGQIVHRNARLIYVLRSSSQARAHSASKEMAVIFDRSINLTIMDQ